MIGGDAAGRAAARPRVRGARAGRGRHSPHARPRDGGGTAEQGYLHCGPRGRGPLREDGAQRHRVRPHGRLRRGPQHPAPCRRRPGRHGTPMPRPRRSSIPSTTSTRSTSPRSPRCGGAAASSASWLLDLSAAALADSPDLARFAGRVSDSGEGRWTIAAAIDESVPDAGAERGALRSLHLARRRRLRAQDALGPALPVRRAPREARRGQPDVSGTGAVRRAGHLRHHRRPRLQADLPGPPRDGAPRPAQRARPGHGAGRARASTQLRARARASIEEHGPLDPAAFATLAGLLRYVGGNYEDPATFAGPARGAGRRRRGRRSTSPSRRACSRRWSSGLAAAGVVAQARVIVEKPFGRDLASAEALNRTLHEHLPRAVDLPDRSLPGQGAGAEPALLPVRQLVPRADLEPQLRRPGADHDGRGLRRAGPRPLLRGSRRNPRRGAEPSAAGGEPAGHGGARRPRHRAGARREGTGVPVDAAARARRRRARAVHAAIATKRAWPRTRRSRPSPPSGCTSTRGAGPACRSTSAPASTCR